MSGEGDGTGLDRVDMLSGRLECGRARVFTGHHAFIAALTTCPGKVAESVVVAAVAVVVAQGEELAEGVDGGATAQLLLRSPLHIGQGLFQDAQVNKVSAIGLGLVLGLKEAGRVLAQLGHSVWVDECVQQVLYCAKCTTDTWCWGG